MDDDERIDLIRRLFALLTAKAEDAAELASEGQGPGVTIEDQIAFASKLQSLGEEIALVSEVVASLLQGGTSADGG